MRMIKQNYRREMAHAGPTRAQLDRLWRTMDDPARPRPPRGRTVLAAVLAAALLTTVALAYSLGVFDFLRGREEYRLLGQAEVYEQYAREVNLTATAENGDVLTIDRVAMDGKFCTVFYSVNSAAPMEAWSERDGSISAKAPDLWQARRLSPVFSLYAGKERLAAGRYDSGQQYLTDAQTLYGEARLLLDRPPVEGEALELRAAPAWTGGAESGGPAAEGTEMPVKWSVPLTAHLVKSERLAQGQKFFLWGQSRNFERLEVLSLDRSPLGTLLTIRETLPEGYWEDDSLQTTPQFALRDGDTGAYIPYGKLNNGREGAGPYRTDVYELYGDVSGLKNLEIVPVRRNFAGGAPRVVVDADDLPVGQGNPDGGYVLTDCAVGDGRIVLTWRPEGAVINVSQCVPPVELLDGEGNRLFTGAGAPEAYRDSFINRADGSVTVIETGVDLPEGYLERLAQLAFWPERYELLPEKAVTIALK